MRIRASSKEISEAVGVIASIVATRTTKQTLQNVLLKTTEGRLELLATDAEISLRIQLRETEIDSPGTTLVSAAQLAAVLRVLEDQGQVEISTDGDENASIRAGRNDYRLPTEDPDDFPAVPDFEVEKPLKIAYVDLQSLVRKTRYATAPDGGRFAMNGVLMEIDADKMRLVATDGKRLALAEKPSQAEVSESFDKGGKLRLVIPPKALMLLERVVERVVREENPSVEIGLGADGRILFARCRNAVIGTLLVDGEFPPYEDVVPSDFDSKLVIPKEPFLSAVRRANVLNHSRESLAMVFAFGRDEVDISSRDPSAGDARVSLPLAYEGEPMEIGFNPGLLIEGLSAIDSETFVLELKDARSAAVIREGEEFLYVVMPIQLV